MPRRIKSGQQHSAADRKNFIFFHCPLDGVRFTEAIGCFLMHAIGYRNTFVPPRWQGAAALSAAVTTTKHTGDRPPSQAEPTPKSQPTQSPTALRERGAGGEGKDSHSRQWRLSMAVFLNRNKRPLAAPIEVAELLSEKPPLSQNLPLPRSSHSPESML